MGLSYSAWQMWLYLSHYHISGAGSAGQVMEWCYLWPTSWSFLIVKPQLSMLDSNRNVVQTVHLTKGAFVANMSFPWGEYTYLLEEVDTSGVRISDLESMSSLLMVIQLSKLIDLIHLILASFTGAWPPLKRSDEVRPGIEANLISAFPVSNLNSYASKFDFTTISPRFIATLQNRSVSLYPQERLWILL